MNRTQAKLLAPIICAFAAGRTIEWQNKQKLQNEPWNVVDDKRGGFDFAAWSVHVNFRIAPKTPKPKFARLALCNLDKVDANNVSALPYVVQIKAAAINEPGWIPAEVIVRKGHCDKFAKHPAFVKWLTNDFQLLTGNNTHADNQRHA